MTTRVLQPDRPSICVARVQYICLARDKKSNQSNALHTFPQPIESTYALHACSLVGREGPFYVHMKLKIYVLRSFFNYDEKMTYAIL